MVQIGLSGRQLLDEVLGLVTCNFEVVKKLDNCSKLSVEWGNGKGL